MARTAAPASASSASIRGRATGRGKSITPRREREQIIIDVIAGHQSSGSRPAPENSGESTSGKPLSRTSAGVGIVIGITGLC